jgi:hypothetical protein
MSLFSNRRRLPGTKTASSRGLLANRVARWIRASSAAARTEHTSDDPVQLWKSTWRLGAEARWHGVPLSANPYQDEDGSAPAKAWRSGWHWAEQQPDRRRAARVRLAHPHRRSGDVESAPLAVARAAQTVSVGVSAVVVAAWLWQSRRKRRQYPVDARLSDEHDRRLRKGRELKPGSP